MNSIILLHKIHGVAAEGSNVLQGREHTKQKPASHQPCSFAAAYTSSMVIGLRMVPS